MILLQKTMKVVKDYFFILALMAAFIGFSAFKATSVLALQPGWYPVDEQGITDNFIYFTSNTPITLDNECAEDIEGEHCAVYLDFPDEGSAPTTVISMTVQDAKDDPDIDVVDRAYREE